MKSNKHHFSVDGLDYFLEIRYDKNSRSNYSIFGTVFRSSDLSPICGKSFRDNSTLDQMVESSKKSVESYIKFEKDATHIGLL